MRKLFKILSLAFVCVCFLFLVKVNSSNAILHISDTLSSSWPGASTSHSILFYVTRDIPASGKILITPENPYFVINPGFDYTDVDLATSSFLSGGFTDRELSDAATGTADIVSVAADSIAINLNSSYGISANTYISIKLGTKASFGEVGDQMITNPAAVGSYGINVKTYDELNSLIENSLTKIAIVEPVSMVFSSVKIRDNGTPSGVLGYTVVQTIMSLTTNYQATCRYSTLPDTLYANMTNQFTDTGAYFHSMTLSGFARGVTYSYYIRCRDSKNVDDTTDYVISFMVSGMEGTTGENTGTKDRIGGGGSGSGGSGGGGGGGGGGGFGAGQGTGSGELLPYPPTPTNPVVILKGFAYPLSEMVVLRDGKEDRKIKAGADSKFEVSFLQTFPQGVYTFGLWAKDSQGIKSSTYSSTFWVKEGTQTNVSNIIIPPTIAIDKRLVASGGTFTVFGQSYPQGKLEILLFPRKDNLQDKDITKLSANANEKGDWSLSVDSKSLTDGDYKIKAKTIIENTGSSEYSQVLDFVIGAGTVNTGTCAGGDLNGDKKVNIVDFSILLYHWGTANACADQNKSGKVDLIDFSIMMFNWTG